LLTSASPLPASAHAVSPSTRAPAPSVAAVIRWFFRCRMSAPSAGVWSCVTCSTCYLRSLLPWGGAGLEPSAASGDLMQCMREETDIGALGIGDAAELLGVTVRTLRHWETIGLLAPEWRTAGGHRLYVEEDLERAQRILVYREVGLPLAEIRALVDGDADARTHLARQRRLLVERASHLRRMIGAVDDMMEAIDMDRKMSAREAAEKFGGGWNEEYAEE